VTNAPRVDNMDNDDDEVPIDVVFISQIFFTTAGEPGFPPGF